MKYSIIIPTIGRGTLNSVIESLILSKKSVHCEVEIIVVFDGVAPSPDLPKSGLTIIQTAKKMYAGGARNHGIDKATGDVLIFIGDDTIPAPDWLQKTIEWHQERPETHEALLGRVTWVDDLAQDRFHRWMNDNAQFDYGRLDRGFVPGWQHFYTSNVSVKTSLVAAERFHEAFRGWGFEDAEFGYRLAKKGLQLHYDGTVQVFHDHPQTPETLINRTQAAHKNAVVFELLHPEVEILPRALKRGVLRTLLILSWPLSFVPEIRWWRIWKKHWLGN